MRTIHKYSVGLSGEFVLNIPDGFECLSVQVQGSTPYLWVLVDTSRPPKLQRFCVAGTGHPVTIDDLKFVGTFQLDGGRLVFHVFLRLE